MTLNFILTSKIRYQLYLWHHLLFTTSNFNSDVKNFKINLVLTSNFSFLVLIISLKFLFASKLRYQLYLWHHILFTTSYFNFDTKFQFLRQKFQNYFYFEAKLSISVLFMTPESVLFVIIISYFWRQILILSLNVNFNIKNPKRHQFFRQNSKIYFVLTSNFRFHC